MPSPIADRESERELRPRLVVAPAEKAEPKVSLDLVGKAYRALQVGYVAVPFIAGVDKFANELTDWPQYLAPRLPRLFGLQPHAFMYIVGAIEIGLGLGIALKPKAFADAFAVWLCLIIVNLLAQGLYFDIALRDFGLAAGACALARLSKAAGKGAPASEMVER